MAVQILNAPIAIRVQNLWVVKGGGLRSNRRAILQDINFEARPGSFVAIVGPNGAGKTTLFKALVGEKPYAGNVLLRQGTDAFEDLYDNPEYWLERIGYVPVDNVLHEDLTVQQALMHVGRLRRPDLSDETLWTRARVNLEKLGINRDDPRLGQLIKTLSSGERKKVNIAAELLTDPPLLLLDEPTSNLDPNAERDLMDSLKNISGEQNNGDGPTVLLITHTLSSIDRCSYVVFIANSRLESKGTFDSVYSDLEQKVTQKNSPEDRENGCGVLSQSPSQFEHWAVIFDCFKTNDKDSRRDTQPPPAGQSDRTTAPRTRRPDLVWRQFQVLSSRYFLARYNDLGGIFTIFFSGFVAGFLLLIAPSEVFLKSKDASAARQTIVLFVILIVITSAFNSHREISKEFRIYIHERSKGLNPLAYVLSKVMWLAIVLGIFVTLIILATTGMPIARVLTLLLAIGLLIVGFSDTMRNAQAKAMKGSQLYWRLAQVVLLALPLFAAFFIQLQNKALPDKPISATIVEIAIIVTLCLTGLAALSLGLLVSSIVGGNNDRATQLVIAVIIANVILAFSVLVVSSREFRSLFATLEPFTATHWGYGGFSTSLDLYCWAGSLRFDDFNSIGHLVSTWLYLGIQSLVAIVGSVLALRLQETWITRRQLLRAVVGERLAWASVLLFAVLISWTAFLSRQSLEYFSLTYYDELYGANRYADISHVTDASFIQQVNGRLNESACTIQSAASSQTAQSDSSNSAQ